MMSIETETGQALQAQLTITAEPLGGPLPARIFGNFLEHLGFSADGGILAQALSNPVFERECNLSDHQVNRLLETGRLLVAFYRAGQDPNVFPERWSPGIGATGFGVSALDDYRSARIPFPWAPIGQEGSLSASAGRIGGALRLLGLMGGQPVQPGGSVPLDGQSSGARQGVFLPVQRCLGYRAQVWARAAAGAANGGGEVEIGLRRRLGDPGQGREAGECLAVQRVRLDSGAWQRLEAHLMLPAGQVSLGEPLDFFMRWLPEQGADLLIDRAFLLPDDAVEGIFDPDVLRLVRELRVPLLRWPGGNFVSHYHWRDGSGPLDRRPTRTNPAWGGLEYNFLGVQEFIHFCRLVPCEPHITVNTGSGTPEEAAAWVEYCNGGADTPMGQLRAASGDEQPYGVKLWEVGNEIYGTWQGGYHGAEENALRFDEFARAMRAADPSIELISTGNQFDIAGPRPALDHTNADQEWNRVLLERGAAEMDYLSLHCLPNNEQFLERASHLEAYYSLMAQPDSWERIFIPALLEMADRCNPPGKPPIGLAITEWGVLGPRGDARPVVENYGEVPYAGVYLNMAIRNAGRIPIHNATALLHGGCIRKAGGQVFYDPQYTVIQQYTPLAGGTPLRCRVESPTYDSPFASDLALPLENVPYLDGAAVEQPERTTLCLVNRHRHLPLQVSIRREREPMPAAARWTYLAYPEITARARLGDPQRFALAEGQPLAQDGALQVTLPPCSVSWIEY